MKKISRLLALLLVVLMLATITVSCKKKDEEEDATVAGTVDSDSKTESGKDDKKENDKESDKKEDGKDEGANTDKKEDATDDKKPSTDKTDTTKPSTGGSGSTAKPQKPQGTQHGEGGGTYTEDEHGNITSTGDHETDDNFVIQDTVTNDNGFIPDEEQGLEKSERYATEQSKYDFDKNPLINRDRQVNREAMPSFNIDDTGFVRAGTTLKDLKGKTLQFFTADNFAAWSYRNAKGETISEWEWFKQLKSELGLNIKYTVKQHQESINAVVQYMNSGKQCDLIYTNHNLQPQALCVSKSITSLVNINNLGSSPGVCKTTMDLCKWGNTLRLIAPIGVVDVLWYNQTLTQELGLPDPHTMWESKVWDWDSFKKYMISAPKTTKDGRELVARVEWTSNIPFTWDKTNGKGYAEIVADAKVPTVKNNWLDPQFIAAMEFVADINKQVNYKCSGEDKATGVCPEHMGLYEGTTLMSATMYTQVYRDTEYSKHVQINWVPFPKANTATGQEVAQYYGFGMVLPRKTAKADNENYALKFMELWATRFTETYFDNLNTFEYYNFNYKQRKQYFDFVTQNVVFSPSFAGRPYYEKEIGTKVLSALGGDAAYNVRTEITKGANLNAQVIAEIMKFGN